MMTAFSCFVFLKIWTMDSNFKFIPYLNILQNFVQNVKKTKWPSILSCLGTSPLGFIARIGENNVHSPKFTSGATLADLLAAGSAVSHFPTCISIGGTWLGFEWVITRTEDEHTTVVPAIRFQIFKVS